MTEGYACVPNLSTARAINVPEGTDDWEEKWDFEGMAVAEEVAPSVHCDILREMQRVSNDSSEAVSAKNVEVIKLACEGMEKMRTNTVLSNRTMVYGGQTYEGRCCWRFNARAGRRGRSSNIST